VNSLPYPALPIPARSWHFSPVLTHHKPTDPRLCHRGPSGAPRGTGIPGCQRNLGQTAHHAWPRQPPPPHSSPAVPGAQPVTARAESPGPAHGDMVGWASSFQRPLRLPKSEQTTAFCQQPATAAKRRGGTEGWGALTCPSSTWKRLSSSPGSPLVAGLSSSPGHLGDSQSPCGAVCLCPGSIPGCFQGHNWSRQPPHPLCLSGWYCLDAPVTQGSGPGDVLPSQSLPCPNMPARAGGCPPRSSLTHQTMLAGPPPPRWQGRSQPT